MDHYKDFEYEALSAKEWPPQDAQKILNSVPNLRKEEQATRHNTGKPQYSLIDLHMLEPLVRVLEYGAEIYDRYNYQKGFPQMQVVDSLLRHIADLIAGEEIDKESGQPTIGCIQANALFLGCKKNTK